MAGMVRVPHRIDYNDFDDEGTIVLADTIRRCPKLEQVVYGPDTARGPCGTDRLLTVAPAVIAVGAPQRGGPVAGSRRRL